MTPTASFDPSGRSPRALRRVIDNLRFNFYGPLDRFIRDLKQISGRLEIDPQACAHRGEVTGGKTGDRGAVSNVAVDGVELQ